MVKCSNSFKRGNDNFKNSVTSLFFCCSNLLKFSSAFTLAEVLIVLGVIGIVAAMTLPNLITKINDRITISKLRQAQSLFSNALERAQDEYGEISIWEATGSTNLQYDLYFNRITQFLKVVQDCGNGNFVNTASCGRGRAKYLRLDGKRRDPGDGHVGYLANGIMFSISAYATNEKTWGSYGYVTVDINGLSAPNTDGKDVFVFHIHDPSDNWAHKNKPRIYPKGQFFNNTRTLCLSGTEATGCTYWALKYNNLDYLYCREKLSENGPYSCKDAK